MLIFLGLPGKGKAGAPKRRETHYQTQHPDHKQASEARRPSEAPGGPDRPPRPPGGAWRHPGGARRPPEARGNPKRLQRRKTRAPDAPESPPEAPEAPGRFRSSEGHDRKSPQPFRKILKGYRSARDKTLDQSQADKGGSGNLGRQPETRKGIKLGGCLRKQGGGKEKPTHQFLVCCAREMRRRIICRPPHTPGCVGGAISTCDLQPPRGETP